jgi:hypothetical protein
MVVLPQILLKPQQLFRRLCSQNKIQMNTVNRKTTEHNAEVAEHKLFSLH